MADYFIYGLLNMPWENIENIDNPVLAWKVQAQNRK